MMNIQRISSTISRGSHTRTWKFARYLSSTEPKKDTESKDEFAGLDPSTFTQRIEIKMPELGVGPGKILKWYKKPGDFVKFEDVICDIQTSDFTFGMEIEDEEVGLFGDTFVPADQDYEVEENDVIATVYHRPEKERQKLEQPDETDEDGQVNVTFVTDTEKQGPTSK